MDILSNLNYFPVLRAGNLTKPPGGVLPYKALIGTCGQPGYVLRHDFCLNRVQGIDFIIFLSSKLIRGIDFINFCLKQGIFSWTINSLRDSVDQAVNSFVIANGLNKKEFRYLLLSYTGYGFGLNVLNRVSKIGILSKTG